jgi:DNA-binding PadR family transcriptional regulator
LKKDNLIEMVKGHERHRPQTLCRITALGRERFLEYLSTLEQVVRDAATGANHERISSLERRLAPSRA